VQLCNIGLGLAQVCEQRVDCPIDPSRYLCAGLLGPCTGGCVQSDDCDTRAGKRDAHT